MLLRLSPKILVYRSPYNGEVLNHRDHCIIVYNYVLLSV